MPPRKETPSLEESMAQLAENMAKLQTQFAHDRAELAATISSAITTVLNNWPSTSYKPQNSQSQFRDMSYPNYTAGHNPTPNDPTLIHGFNGRQGNLGSGGIIASTCHDDEGSGDVYGISTDGMTHKNHSSQHEDMTLQDIYNKEGDFDDEDDSDWEPFPKHIPVEKWICINCTMVNLDDAIYCHICGEHKESRILRHGFLASPSQEENSIQNISSERDGKLRASKYIIRSGFIDAKEIQQALSSGYQKFSLGTTRLLMFLFRNPTDDLRIGLKELAELWNCLGHWMAIFERFDRDRSGKSDATELRDALYRRGYAVPPPTAMSEQQFLRHFRSHLGGPG